MTKADKGIELPCTKTKLLIETLTEKILTCLEGNQVLISRQIKTLIFFGCFRPSSFCCRGTNVLCGTQVTPHEGKSVGLDPDGLNSASSFREQKV